MRIEETVQSAERIDGGAAVRVRFADGVTARYHALWLRDGAADGSTRDATSGQRLLTVLDLPGDLRADAVAVRDGRLSVRFAPGGHRARYDGAWLRANRYDRPRAPGRGVPARWVRTWDARLGASPPRAGFLAVRDDPRALAAWLDAVRVRGFALLHGVPAEPGALERVVALFGHVRETNYGRLFDVRVDAAPSNLAYTGLGLQVHTDNPYRDPVPTLQLLHCLRGDVRGGESVVVDGFRAAARLREAAPEAFERLATTPARFAFRDRDGLRLVAREPMIRLAADGELRGVRFNNRSFEAFEARYDEMPLLYEAYRGLARVLESPRLAVRFRLAPGDVFVVDNERVLHGRSAFASRGHRHLQGCYADRDGLLGRLAALRAAPGEAA